MKNIILEKIACLNPKDKGDYAIVACPSCDKDAYVYYKAGRFAHICCNHLNLCGRRTPISNYWKNDWSPDGHVQELAQYAEKHGLNLKGLEEIGLIDVDGNILCVAPGRTKQFAFKHKENKYGWISKGIKKNEIGRSFYRPFVGNPQNETLYIFEGDADFLKACQDQINCTGTLFGAASIPTDENIAEWQAYKTIIICLNSDHAGMSNAGKLSKILLKAFTNKRIGIMPLPLQSSQGKDYCDYRKIFDVNQFLQIETTWCEMSKSEKKFAAALKSTIIPEESIIKRIASENGIGYVITKNAVYIEKCVENEITKEKHNTYEKIIDQTVMVNEIIQDIWTGEESVSLMWGQNQKGIFPVESISFSKHIDMLASKGIRLNSINSKDAIAYFAAVLGRDEIKTSFSSFKNGWIDDGRFIYGNEIVGDKTDKISFQGTTYIPESLGTKEKWLEIIKMFKDDVGISFRLGGAVISPALKKIGCTSFVNHFWGSSSSGKTLSSFLAASIFGNPYKLVENWNQSRAGKETYFEEAGGFPVFLDEAHQAKPEDLELTCYDFANEKGKGRAMIANGEVRKAKAKEWFGALLSTGECQIKEYSQKAGMEARMLEMQRVVIISEEEGRKVAKAKTLLHFNFGHMGKEIILHIIKEKESIKRMFELYIEQLAEYSNNNLQSRQIPYIAASLTGCHILTSLGIPISNAENLWNYALDYMKSEIPMTTWQKALDYIYDQVAIHKDKFEVVEKNAYNNEITTSPEKECWGKIHTEGIDFIPEALKTILKGGGFDSSVLKILASEGKIQKDLLGKNSIPSRIRGNLKRIIRFVTPL